MGKVTAIDRRQMQRRDAAAALARYEAGFDAHVLQEHLEDERARARSVAAQKRKYLAECVVTAALCYVGFAACLAWAGYCIWIHDLHQAGTMVPLALLARWLGKVILSWGGGDDEKC